MSDEIYKRLVTALADIEPDDFAGGIENKIKIVLGDVGDIWPLSIANVDCAPKRCVK